MWALDRPAPKKKRGMKMADYEKITEEELERIEREAKEDWPSPEEMEEIIKRSIIDKVPLDDLVQSGTCERIIRCLRCYQDLADTDYEEACKFRLCAVKRIEAVVFIGSNTASLLLNHGVDLLHVERLFTIIIERIVAKMLKDLDAYADLDVYQIMDMYVTECLNHYNS